MWRSCIRTCCSLVSFAPSLSLLCWCAASVACSNAYASLCCSFNETTLLTGCVCFSMPFDSFRLGFASLLVVRIQLFPSSSFPHTVSGKHSFLVVGTLLMSMSERPNFYCWWEVGGQQCRHLCGITVVKRCIKNPAAAKHSRQHVITVGDSHIVSTWAAQILRTAAYCCGRHWKRLGSLPSFIRVRELTQFRKARERKSESCTFEDVKAFRCQMRTSLRVFRKWNLFTKFQAPKVFYRQQILMNNCPPWRWWLGRELSTSWK